MEKTIYKLLETTVKNNPEKVAFTDNTREITFEGFLNESKIIGSNLLKYKHFNKPIAIYLDKNINCLTSMMGINYSGNYYTIIDVKMPMDRVESIFNTLEPVCVITDSKNITKLNHLSERTILVNIDEIEKTIDEEGLNCVDNEIIDTNPMYVLFTSGSTGVPKLNWRNRKTSYIRSFRLNYFRNSHRMQTQPSLRCSLIWRSSTRVSQRM